MVFIALPLAKVPGLDMALALLFAETDRVRCGQRLLADRLFEVVVLQLLRWLLDHPQEAGVRPGLITGLSDPRLARALVAMHNSPGEPWTLERMAERRRGFINNNGGIAGLKRDEDDTVHNTDAYAQAEWKFLPRWSATATGCG